MKKIYELTQKKSPLQGRNASPHLRHDYPTHLPPPSQTQLNSLALLSLHENQIHHCHHHITNLTATIIPKPPSLYSIHGIMDLSSFQSLPPLSSISSSALTFLNDKLSRLQDLETAPVLLQQLQTQCLDLDKALHFLSTRLDSCLSAYASFSDRLHALSTDAASSLAELDDLTREKSSVSDGEKKEKVLGEELPKLAKEVARVEMVRAYAETALKLDTLVGDIEDAVSSVMNKNLRKQSSAQSLEEIRLHAIKALERTEDVLFSVMETRPQWTRLVSAVDHRIDRALAILRPQAIADHRNLLNSLGWPPQLSTLTNSSPSGGKSTEVSNPLFTMRGDLKHQYCENFLALCCLQELQRRRKSRQLEGYNREVALHQPLWAIEELVNPISIACQRHFSKWTNKPGFIFALVYKITRDYVDSMDELLQPLVDEARLVGYSCREEWVSAMVTSLSTYLAKEIFPIYVGQLEEEGSTDNQAQAKVSWLQLVDLMINFDKQIQSMATHSGILLSLEEDGNPQKISSFSVFCDRPDWLDIWAEIELSDALDKLKPEVDNERTWDLKVQAAVLSGSENYKSPAVSGVFLKHLSFLIDRCKALPTTPLRVRFLRQAGVPVMRRFLDCVLFRCQEAEGLTALTDDNALIKLASSINAARYFESALKEWCEDIFFLEMAVERNDPLEMPPYDDDAMEGTVDGPVNGIFDDDVEKLEDFRKEWVEKISVVVLRGFDASSRDYLKNRRQWQETTEEGWTVSKTFVTALDYLEGKMKVIEENLNVIDFVTVWRSLAAGVDRLLFNSILMSNVKFHESGAERFSNDLQVLFGVFRAWCVRPEGFFPKTSESLKLLKNGDKQLNNLTAMGKWMKENGIRHLSVAETEKILNSRVFKN